MSKKIEPTILCVEDEQDIRENIAEVLRDEGFKVFEAENGNAGFKAFLKHKPHLVISDIMMPELDGYGLLKKIRNDKTTRNNNVPFIFLTALGQKEDIIKGVDMSANDYLIKPIEFDLLIAKSKEKTDNSIKLIENQEQKISNIKSQFTNIIPTEELFSYLNVITQICEILQEEPYGALKDKRYLEDFKKIHNNATKLRSAITNFVDQSTIENKLNANEEIISIEDFFQKFTKKLNEKYKSKITFDGPYEDESIAKAKLDKLSFIDATKRILANMLKIDRLAKIEISTMLDRLNQMIIIFYLDSNQYEIDPETNFNISDIKNILAEQNITVEISNKNKNTILVSIPSFRII